MADRKEAESINRAATPMTFVEENFEESREKQIQRRKELEEGQKAKSPFLIGSIDEINRRISTLDHKLQSYSELVVESRATDVPDDDYTQFLRPPSAEGRERYLHKEREAKEVHRFAGLYTLKANSDSAFTPGVSERVKNISKISMNPSKTQVKKDDGKPKFVELHQYPGFDPGELTALPNDISALEILTKVADAQPKLRQKIGGRSMLNYRPEFERLFYSQMSRAILQDVFWWYFQEKYQPGKQPQMKLFNRISHNYVKLLSYAKNPQYRDTFFKDYPSLLSQAVYAAFCATFPDSYRQYNAEFKEGLISLIYEWLAGLRPSPSLWQSWNLDYLEPANIKAREDMMTQAKDKKSSVLNFDFLESSTSQYTGSQSTLNHLGTSMSSMSGASFTTRKHALRRNGTSRQTLSQSSPVFSESGVIQSVAEAQKNKKFLKKKSSKGLVGADSNKSEIHEQLTPIREFQEDEAAERIPGTKGSKISGADAKSYLSVTQPKRKPKKESHTVGRGPEFARNVFNIQGQSPLVAHFLRMKNLQDDAGMVIRVQRTEVDSLPPVGTQTYQDMIHNSFRGLRQLEKDYNTLVERDRTDRSRFINKQRKEQRDHLRRQKALLSQPREVKRLSDLLILELKDIPIRQIKLRRRGSSGEDEKDEDSIPAGASAAVEAALQSVIIEN